MDWTRHHDCLTAASMICMALAYWCDLIFTCAGHEPPADTRRPRVHVVCEVECTYGFKDPSHDMLSRRLGMRSPFNGVDACALRPLALALPRLKTVLRNSNRLERSCDRRRTCHTRRMLSYRNALDKVIVVHPTK